MRNYVRELWLPHVLQRFVGTNFLSDGDLSDNLLTKHPEKYLIRYITVCRTSSIIPCRNGNIKNGVIRCKILRQ